MKTKTPTCNTCKWYTTHDCGASGEGICMANMGGTYAPGEHTEKDHAACSQYLMTEKERKRLNRNARARIGRAAYADAMDSCGLTKVRSDSGLIYWE